MRSMTRSIPVVAAALSLTACFHVKNQLYNPAEGNSPKSVVRVFADHDSVDPNCNPSENACLAFLEFDEMGEMWDRAQLQKAIALIRKAKSLSPHPVIVTFTHGWKNNADDNPKHVNGNVFGFEGVLNYLQTTPRFANSPVVGIYIGWRGNLVSDYWPVRQQLSYFNRESAAIRIPGASLTAALTEIMTETHRESPNPFLVMVGHSFGGLVMERALTQAMTDFILRGGETQNGVDGAWADLIVFVNSAAAASEGKQMLDLLYTQKHSRRLRYAAPVASVALEARSHPELARTPERPLFLSVSSLGDTATRFGLVIGHGPSDINRQLKGSWRTYQDPQPWGVANQSSFYLSTTAHMPVLQSHAIVENNADGQAQCGCAFDLTLKNPDGSPRCKTLVSPTPVRVTIGKATNSACAGAAAGTPQCPTKDYFICEGAGRKNDTAYWAMEMPVTIVPDHSGIFNLNFISLLMKFLPSETEMRNPETRPRFIPAASEQ